MRFKGQDIYAKTFGIKLQGEVGFHRRYYIKGKVGDVPIGEYESKWLDEEKGVYQRLYYGPMFDVPSGHRVVDTVKPDGSIAATQLFRLRA